MYRPLPDCLTIKESSIEGLGLFAKEDIPAGTDLGISHYRMVNGLFRTPLGGFYNHSISPNCRREENKVDNLCTLAEYSLVTIEDIKAGEELTATYTEYDPTS